MALAVFATLARLAPTALETPQSMFALQTRIALLAAPRFVHHGHIKLLTNLAYIFHLSSLNLPYITDSPLMAAIKLCVRRRLCGAAQLLLAMPREQCVQGK
jgi:hypothetical protein